VKGRKKIKEAAALQYSPDKDSAPRIVALGKGETAERIVEAAKDSSVPVYENAELAHTLNLLHIGDEIPPELYEVVADILVFVSSLDKNYALKYGVKTNG
jgi:flagellar biosynthesis protein